MIYLEVYAKIKSQLLMIHKCVHVSAEIQKPKDFREFRSISEKKKYLPVNFRKVNRLLLQFINSFS